jgi:hypothetical protein
MLSVVGAAGLVLVTTAAGAPRSATACVSVPVHYEPGPRADLRSLPWVKAGARDREIFGYLFYYGGERPDPGLASSSGLVIYTGGKMPDAGRTTKILWVPRRPGLSMRIRGRRLDGPGAFRQAFPASGTAFPSIVDVPRAGCWRLTLRTGSVSARLAVLAITP